VSRRLAALTLDTVGDLPGPCRGCVAWELDPVAAAAARRSGGVELEKESWLSGRIAYVDDEPVGFVTYAPPQLVPRAASFPTSPVSADAVLLMTGAVQPVHRGGGIARMLVQGAAKDLTRRGVRAIEAFGSTDGTERAIGQARDDPHGCLVPADLLLAVGFKTVRPHRRTPRLRLDLRTALSWREDVEHALERILGTVRVPALASG
jgi:GNAT superfamily N-acetyltransferase